jgi:PAS domain S-box-containing protein
MIARKAKSSSKPQRTEPFNRFDRSRRNETPDETMASKALLFQKFALDQAAIVAITDARGRITMVNDKFCQISKYSREELIGQDHRIINSGKHPKEFFKQMYATIARGKVWHGEICNRAKDGSLYWVDTTIVPIVTGQSSGISGYIAIRHDITELKNMQDHLRVAKEMAEAAARAKGEFLANMSHEIRTPMTAIIGYADLLSDQARSTQERAEFVETIRRNGEHLLCVINDILDISKIESGKLQAEHISFDPSKIIADVESSMRVRAMEKGVGFAVEYKGRMPQMIHSDPTRLRQILLNLVSNAVKFTKEGSIRISVSYDSSRRKVCFSVADTGIGLSTEQQAVLFQPFAQADGSTTRRFGGTGLGLALCKRLIEALGGAISVQSELGKGSTFVFTVDDAEVADEHSAPAEVESQTAPERRGHIPRHLRGRVLLVEDGADNRRLVSVYLEAAGLHVDTAVDGRNAIQMIMDAQESGKGYDAVLMDMQMPEVDGYTATAEVRHRGLKDLPIIAFTANVMAGEKQKCIDSGCNDYSTKPVNPDALIQTLGKYIHNTRKKNGKSTMITIPPKPSASAAESPAPTSSPAAPAKGIVRSQLLDKPAVARVLPEYIAGLPEQVAEIRSALEHHDLDSVRRFVHQLRGSGGAYGFPDITRLASDAETAIDQKAAIDTIVAQVQGLIELISRVEGYQDSIPLHPDPAAPKSAFAS